MKATKLLFLLLLLCAGCHHKDQEPKPDIAFNRTQWDVKDEKGYTFRKQMIHDLLTKHTWTGLKKDSVTKILGSPDGVEENIFMLYHYEQKYVGSFVLSTQSLVIQLAPDSTVILARTN